MKAIATRRFLGVQDGEVMPVVIEEGQEIHGDLAKRSVRDNLARWAAPETAAIAAAPENKARKRTPE